MTAPGEIVTKRDEIARELPEHKCGLFLTHNEHRDYYETAAQYIEDHELEEEFESPEAMKRAIEADSIWVLQWYPNTPVGFNRVAAPTLEECLALAAPRKEPRNDE